MFQVSSGVALGIPCTVDGTIVGESGRATKGLILSCETITRALTSDRFYAVIELDGTQAIDAGRPDPLVTSPIVTPGSEFLMRKIQ